ncbi:MAG: type II secretion system protein GspJ [Planctomycetota bacterium]
MIPTPATYRKRDSRPGPQRAGGFTLIELLVAASLVGIVLAASAILTYQVSRARGNVDKLAAHHAEADAALRAITSALSQQFRNTRDDPPVFVGADEEYDGRPADRLRFFTVSNRVIRPEQPESDVHEVEFYLEPQNGEPYPALLRRTDPTRNEIPDGGGVIELVARGIGGFDVEYFDGARWLTDWPEFLNTSPTAVRVTVGVSLDEEAETLRPYRRLIHFPMMPGLEGESGGTSIENGVAGVNAAGYAEGGESS